MISRWNLKKELYIIYRFDENKMAEKNALL